MRSSRSRLPRSGAGRALEAALAKLREFDAAHRRAGAPRSEQQARRALVIEAGHALWMFMVQREACGLRESRTVMRDYDVPGEVQKRMGPGFIGHPIREQH